ncbi:hypothetical protein FS749_012675 [Ceratobasidium sp. UAMH 11750]|nr:hypothetical protein FS749_012675 [Ceratobasidium sp. UAMH 11750]
MSPGIDRDRKCSWGDENDDHRPPTKQYVEILRVKIRAMEAEIARIKAANSEQSRQTNPPGSGISTGANQLRPAVQAIGPTREYEEQSPWPAHHTKCLLGSTDAGGPLGVTYQYIFNIHPSVPFHEQPEAIRQSYLCDWNHHLPQLNDIQLTCLEHDTLLDRYFKYLNCWLIPVIPQFFLHDMLCVLAHSHSGSETDYYSPLLHCSILALATALSDDPSIKHRETREIYAMRAKQLLHGNLHRPCLALIQGLVILSEYHNGLGEMEQGYMYLGMGIRAVRAPLTE